MDRVELKSKSAAISKQALRFTGLNELHMAIIDDIPNKEFDALVKKAESKTNPTMLNEKGGPLDETPLHAAVRAGQKYKVARLMGAPGIILNVLDRKGKTPLEVADLSKSSGNTEMEIYRMLYLAK